MPDSELNPQPLPPGFRFRPHIFTDPIWMEFMLEAVEAESRTELAAIRLETVANVYSAIAEGARKAAGQIRSS
jgi:hypothetical protein